MKGFLLLAAFSASSFVISAGSDPVSTSKPSNSNNLNLEKLRMVTATDTVGKFFIHIPQLYNDRWDTLAQAKFWRTLIRLQPDYGIVNVASTRKIIEIVNTKDWDRRPDLQKDMYRDSVRNLLGLASDEKIYFTKGKADFYDFEGAMETIDSGVAAFEREKTDPFYAQAILLIESPGKCAKSSVGACGSFQLMKSVALQMGLKVNNVVDERKDFDKSAEAAARFIKKICIPQARDLCASHGLKYNETDLWFRLLVMHVYHAGAGNVSKALHVAQPKTGSMEVITSLWQTKAGAFGNASQNYSQVALAALLELDEIIFNRCVDVSFHPLANKD
jgi:hypothetical protein